MQTQKPTGNLHEIMFLRKRRRRRTRLLIRFIFDILAVSTMIVLYATHKISPQEVIFLVIGVAWIIIGSTIQGD